MYKLYNNINNINKFKSFAKYNEDCHDNRTFMFQVWKIALQEEFNITHLNDISSDAYYEIWHSRYSEPGQLKMAKNYRMTPDALNCLLASYKAGNKSVLNCRTKSVVDSTKN